MNLDQAVEEAKEKNEQEEASGSNIRYITVTDPPGEPVYAKEYAVIAREVR